MIISKLHSVINKYNTRRSKPVSIRELSRELGINRTTFLNLVNNKANNISFKNLNKLIEFFNVNVSDLIEYSNNSYIINLDYMNNFLISKNFAINGLRNPVTHKRIHDFYILTCDQIPNVYFVIIPFLVHKSRGEYRFEMLCHCAGVSPLSRPAIKFQRIIKNLPKAVMYMILASIYKSLEFDKGLRTEFTTKPMNAEFSNYAKVSNLLNSMVNFNGYHLIVSGYKYDNFVFTNLTKNKQNDSILKSYKAHDPIKLLNGKTCKIYDNITTKLLSPTGTSSKYHLFINR